MSNSKPALATPVKSNKWYFGGLASAGAACCTHPLDLLKVHLQTTGVNKSLSFVGQAKHVIASNGFMSLYNGISASLLRQFTYSTTRFAIYEVSKESLSQDGKSIPFLTRLGLASFAGFCGGIVGTPGDMINVRMQNDVKLKPEERRNYKHAIDGVMKVGREEGFTKLFSGAHWASSRAIFVTVGQLCFYDVIKEFLLTNFNFDDNIKTHLTSSVVAGMVATTLTQPLDVLKTVSMNSKPGEFNNALHLLRHIGCQGPLAFYKGFIPAFIRLGPHTVLTFVFLEQLKTRL